MTTLVELLQFWIECGGFLLSKQSIAKISSIDHASYKDYIINIGAFRYWAIFATLKH